MYDSAKILEPQPCVSVRGRGKGKGQGWWLAFESQEWSEHTVTLLIRNDHRLFYVARFVWICICLLFC